MNIPKLNATKMFHVFILMIFGLIPFSAHCSTSNPYPKGVVVVPTDGSFKIFEVNIKGLSYKKTIGLIFENSSNAIWTEASDLPPAVYPAFKTIHKKSFCSFCVDLNALGKVSINNDTNVINLELYDLSLYPAQNIFFNSTSSDPTLGHGLWVNYDLQKVFGNQEAFYVAPGLNYSYGKNYFFSDFIYQNSNNENTFKRRNSYYVRQNNQNYLRLGDFTSPTFGIDNSYFTTGLFYSNFIPLKQQLSNLDFKGQNKVSTNLEVYVDNQKVSEQRLSPGQYNLSGIPTGTDTVLLKFTDDFGNTRIVEEKLFDRNGLIPKGDKQFQFFTGINRVAGEEEYQDGIIGYELKSGEKDNLTVSSFGKYQPHDPQLGFGVNYANEYGNWDARGTFGKYPKNRITYYTKKLNATVFTYENEGRTIAGWNVGASQKIKDIDFFANFFHSDGNQYSVSARKRIQKADVSASIGKTFNNDYYSLFSVAYNFGKLNTYNTYIPSDKVLSNLNYQVSDKQFLQAFLAPNGSSIDKNDNKSFYNINYQNFSKYAYFKTDVNSQNNQEYGQVYVKGAYQNKTFFPYFDEQAILNVKTNIPNVEVFINHIPYRTNSNGNVSVPLSLFATHEVSINQDSLPKGFLVEDNLQTVFFDRPTSTAITFNFIPPGIFIKPNFKDIVFFIDNVKYENKNSEPIYITLSTGNHKVQVGQNHWSINYPEYDLQQNVYVLNIGQPLLKK